MVVFFVFLLPVVLWGVLEPSPFFLLFPSVFVVFFCFCTRRNARYYHLFWWTMPCRLIVCCTRILRGTTTFSGGRGTSLSRPIVCCTQRVSFSGLSRLIVCCTLRVLRGTTTFFWWIEAPYVASDSLLHSTGLFFWFRV